MKLRSLDEENIVLPAFLSDGFNKMPPTSGFEILAQHIVGLVTEIGSLKEEISQLKQKDSSSDISAVRAEIRGLKVIVENKFKGNDISSVGRNKRNSPVNNSENSNVATVPNVSHAQRLRRGNSQIRMPAEDAQSTSAALPSQVSNSQSRPSRLESTSVDPSRQKMLAGAQPPLKLPLTLCE